MAETHEPVGDTLIGITPVKLRLGSGDEVRKVFVGRGSEGYMTELVGWAGGGDDG